MKSKTNSQHGHRFPREIISHGVWLYYRFSLSLRDVEELLAMRGFKSAGQAQRFLSVHGIIRHLCNLGRHQLSSANYHLLRERSFKEWSAATAA